VATIVDRLTSRQNRWTLVAVFAVTAFVVFFALEFWREGQAVDLDKFIRFIVIGIVLASIYAIAAAGLVVTYTTSGIFNFAQGAMGMFFAFVYWQLKADTDGGGWALPAVPSLIVTVLIVAPLVGALIERLIMRKLTDASLVAQLVATIGLLAFFIGLADTIWASNTFRTIGTFFGTSSTNTGDLFGTGVGLGDTQVPYFRITTIVTGIALAIGLRILLYRTRLGIAMRAVVDNRELAALNGAKPGRVSSFSWALSSSMAAVAGIFLAQEFGNFDSQGLTLFVVEAFAAAIIGRLRSLPMTLVGGAVIGFAVSFQREFLSFPARWDSLSLPGVIPGIVLFLALLFLPQARIEGRKVARAITARVPSLKAAAIGFLVLFAVVLVLAPQLSSANLLRVEFGVVVAFAMLSLVPLTGWSGQISFAQITFMGFGAWAAFEFSSTGGNAFGVELYGAGNPIGLLIGALAAVPIGLLMALPALRLQGLYLALASMAFALMAVVLFDFPEVYSNTGRKIEPIELFGQRLDQPFTLLGVEFGAGAGFLLLATALFCLLGFGVVWIRRSSFGRRLIAMRDSPAACATLGVNLLRTKLAVFALSSAIAGFAGGVAGVHHGNVQGTNFAMLEGLPYLLLVVVGGVAVVSGAVFGASAFQIFTVFLPNVWAPNVIVNIFGAVKFNLFQLWGRLAPGLAGIGIARQPEGVIPQVGHDIRERRRKKAAGAPPAAEPALATAGAQIEAKPPAPAGTGGS
jgi:branched-subunit amino acid ABC-type transport system permease component